MSVVAEHLEESDKIAVTICVVEFILFYLIFIYCYGSL